MRHEDHPACGCGPEGCIDFDRVVECGDCGQEYHPDPQTETYCYRCQAEHIAKHVLAEDDDYYYDFDVDPEDMYDDDDQYDRNEAEHEEYYND